MKNLLLSLCLVSIFLSCNVESIKEAQSEQLTLQEKKSNVKNINVVISESTNPTSNGTVEHCKTINLVAGQNHIAGTVSIDVDGDNLVVTYTSNSDWTINATHLHITNCEVDGFPTTKSNNPKIGNFEYASTHADNITEVIYLINLSDVTEQFCFAAHAEVSGSSEETAWAEGESFTGNSWAMFVEANLEDCETDGDEDGGGAY
ncbi:hypothetical protein [Hwangdonia seohaensis]|uniref:CHRD domain-containing protein n=1 Tax=Hwangdonia seohaensis TaxID=1240727 RepID=A0ABW3R7U1_9FLAO|nr:hypothetical protein [Hwangdonia seohaensis]